MQILDTQIVSYAYKGCYDGEIMGQSIASTTAKEFLMVQGAERTKAYYYVPLMKHILLSTVNRSIVPKMDHPFSKRYTDQILIDFGNLFPPIMEFSNLALAQAITLKSKGTIAEAIRFLDKDRRKVILNRFNFIISNDINCLPLNRRSIEISLDLFEAFISKYNAKGNIVNTINDIFILAIAITSSATLITKDSLLHRFTSELYDAQAVEKGGALTINFKKRNQTGDQIMRESKGYINKGWQVQVRNYKGW